LKYQTHDELIRCTHIEKEEYHNRPSWTGENTERGPRKCWL